jgi:hypothetical protein
MNPNLNVRDRLLFSKLAEGLEDYVVDLPRKDEEMVRRRSRMAAKLKHLPPELALAVTSMFPGGGGGLPIYREPGENVEAVQALRQATDPNRATRAAVGYGLPAAAAGAILAHLVSGGSTAATLGGAAVGGGAVGALAHRGEKAKQRSSAVDLLGKQDQYQQLRDSLIQQRLASMQQQEASEQAVQKAAMLKTAIPVGPNYGNLFKLEGFVSRPGSSSTSPTAIMGGTGDSSMGPTDTGRGMIWEDFYNKWAALKAAASGNAMGISGVPRPPSPSAGGMGIPAMGTSAPKMVAPKLPSVNATMKLPGPVTPNSNQSAAQPPATRMPLFGSSR